MKHIMLLFLSDIKTKRENPKKSDSPIVISTAKYDNVGEPNTTEATNESAVRNLMLRPWPREDGAAAPIGRPARLFLVASKKVREETFQTKNMPAPMTHLTYFQQRLQTTCGLTPGEEDIYPYDEKADVLKTMEMTADIAHRIHEYIRGERKNGEDVIVHVDMTGGLRHANMMLLNVMRLLQYEKIDIGYILYSNYDRSAERNHVDDVGGIFHTLDLIAGAEEFARFGSIKAIKDYFRQQGKDDCSPELRALLNAMDTFAEEIKLCHARQFADAARKLKEALDAFHSKHLHWREQDGQTTPQRLNDKLMLQLEDRLFDDYRSLFEAGDDPIGAIVWCLQHDHLQQAINLYIEKIPDHLIETHHYLVLSDTLKRGIKKSCAPYTPNFYFLNHYNVSREKDCPDSSEQSRQHMAGQKAKAPRDLESARGSLQDFIQQNRLWKKLRSGRQTPEGIAGEIRSWLESHLPAFYLRINASLENWLQEEYAECQTDLQNHLPKQEIAKKDESRTRFLRSCLQIDRAYPLLALMEKNDETGQPLLRSSLPRHVLQSILNTYGLLKRERNNEDHSKEEDDVLSAKDLSDTLKKAVSDLKSLENTSTHH